MPCPSPLKNNESSIFYVWKFAHLLLFLFSKNKADFIITCFLPVKTARRVGPTLTISVKFLNGRFVALGWSLAAVQECPTANIEIHKSMR